MVISQTGELVISRTGHLPMIQLGFWGVSLTIKYLFVSSIRSSSVYHGLFSAVAMDLAELHITCKKKLNRKTFERPNICYVFEKLGV